MNPPRARALLLVFIYLGCVPELTGQELQIGIIDFYGLRRVSERDVRQTLTFKEGDTISLGANELRALLAESERRIATLPGVARAHVHLVKSST
jgi:outer membrane protein assembly factor BamA